VEVVGTAVSELEVDMDSTSGPLELNLDTIDPEHPRETFRYRILRYAPNVVRDEWVNVGVMLEDLRTGRLAVRLIEQAPEFSRVLRIHPDADEELLRALPQEFSDRLRGTAAEITLYLEKLNQSLSNALQLSPQRGLLADNFDAEMDRLYRAYVTPPSRRPGGVLQNIRELMREKLTDVFRRHRILGKLESQVRIEGFTHPGDPLRLDFGYQNGVRGFVHSVSLKRDAAQAKVLAYTAARIRARDASTEVTAITEIEPQPDNRRHQFVSGILAEQQIRIVPMTQVEGFAEELRLRLN
jgi:Protein of unknown function (DUF3037)